MTNYHPPVAFQPQAAVAQHKSVAPPVHPAQQVEESALPAPQHADTDAVYPYAEDTEGRVDDNRDGVQIAVDMVGDNPAGAADNRKRDVVVLVVRAQSGGCQVGTVDRVLALGGSCQAGQVVGRLDEGAWDAWEGCAAARREGLVACEGHRGLEDHLVLHLHKKYFLVILIFIAECKNLVLIKFICNCALWISNNILLNITFEKIFISGSEAIIKSFWKLLQVMYDNNKKK